MREIVSDERTTGTLKIPEDCLVMVMKHKGKVQACKVVRTPDDDLSIDSFEQLVLKYTEEILSLFRPARHEDS